MSQEQLLTQLADLQRANAALTEEVAALRSERDRLVGALQLVFPLPTPEELATAEANAGQFTQLIDRLAAEHGVAHDGR
jgi:hypothetical protein